MTDRLTLFTDRHPMRTDKDAQRDHIHRLVEEAFDDRDGHYKYRCIDCSLRLKRKSGVIIRKGQA